MEGISVRVPLGFTVQAVSLVTNEQAETQERIHLFLSISLPLNIHFCIQYIFFELLQAPGILLAKKILSPLFRILVNEPSLPFTDLIF